MQASEWKQIIRDSMEQVGTYKEAFEPTMNTLADILEQRDSAYATFVAEGAQLIITKTSDRGQQNAAKNPLYVQWTELNTQALAYWRDLGLTPKGLKAINDNAVKSGAKKETDLTRALKMLAGGADE